MPNLADYIAQGEQGGGLLGIIDQLARTPLSKVVMFVAVCSVIRFALYPYLSKTPAHLRDGKFTAAKFFNEFLDAVVYAGVFVFMIIRPFFVQTFYIPSGSMVQTLQVNDYIIANKMIYRYSDPKVGDIIVFKPPKIALKDQKESDYIKRLQGVPGDIVEWKNNKLYRNGKEINEPYKAFTSEEPPFSGKFRNLNQTEIDALPKNEFHLIEYKGRIMPLNVTEGTVNFGCPDTFQIPPEDWEAVQKLPPAKIPAGMYLFMGDNRNNSFDGRYWGLVPRASIIGRSEVIWLPLGRIRITR